MPGLMSSIRNALFGIPSPVPPGRLSRSVQKLLASERRRERKAARKLAAAEYERRLEKELNRQCPDISNLWRGE